MTSVPNFGRNIAAREPPGVEHLYFDTHEAKEVILIVFVSPGVAPPHRHWAIVWEVGKSSMNTPVYRQCEIVRERGPRGPEPHLTSWGPKTRITGDITALYGRHHSLGFISYQDRQRIEEIVAKEPVLVPDGIWSCQSWVASVVNKCVNIGVFNATTARYVIQDAMR